MFCFTKEDLYEGQKVKIKIVDIKI
jgi:hypothetical protein